MTKRKSGPPPIVYILAILATASLGYVGFKRGFSSNELDRGNGLPFLGGGKEREWIILGDTFSGYSTFRSAKFQEALNENGISVRYEDEFDQSERAARLERKTADLILTTLDRVLKHQPKGKIVGLVDRTVGADAVVLNTPKYKDLKSLTDLQRLVESSPDGSLGLTYAAGTPSEFLTQVLDIRFEAFELSDFEHLEVEEASQAWQLLQDKNQTIAVAVLWEPFVSRARQQGYTVVLSSQDAPNAILDVIVASEELIERNGEALSKFLTIYYRHIDKNARNSSELKEQIALDADLSPTEAGWVADGIDFFTSVEADRWMKTGPLTKRIGATAAILALSGQISQVPAAPETLYSDRFITEAVQNTETLIQLVEADNPELARYLRGEVAAVRQQPQLSSEEIQTAQPIGNLQVRGEISFETGSAAIDRQGQETLAQLATEINEFSPQTVAVQVIGHTSKTGAADFNRRLSQQRARVVVNYLQSQGGVSHNILAEGKGFDRLLVGIPAADSRNQRTEIRLVRIAN